MVKTNDNGDDTESTFSRPNLVLANVVILVVFLLLVAGVYLWVVKKNKGQLIFPAGINYLSPTNETAPVGNTPLFDFKKLAESADWVTYKGKIYPYSFQHPKAMAPLVFPNDPTDAVAFKVSSLPPEQSLMFLVETISSRDKKLVGKPEQFIREYWKFFSGLKGLNKIESVTNEKGLKGYKASYQTKANIITSDNYFFIIEGDDDHLLHLANTIPVAEGEAVFNRIVNSLDYGK